MEQVIRGVLWLHVASGFAAFFCAPVAIFTAKGGKIHRRFGKYYLYLMGVVCLSAMIVAVYKPIVFLALVALFSYYFAFKGWRVLQRKNGPAQAPDWGAALLMVASGVALILIGWLKPSGIPMPSPAVCIVFGIVAIAFAGFDIFQFLHPIADKMAWWYAHMSGMLASYIAAVSAFSVVNFHFLSETVRWLWPTAIGVPGITLWIIYYQRKFNKKKDAATA